MKKFYSIPVLLILSTLSASSFSFDADLAKNAAKCDAEIGVTVPAFDCDAGTLVPTTLNGEKVLVRNSDSDPWMDADKHMGVFKLPDSCDRPNVLNHTCDPGSKFQVLVNTPEAYVVAHCRRKGNPKSVFGDIAVIQHNKVTGATCFYQNETFGSEAAGEASDRNPDPNNMVGAPRSGESELEHQDQGCLHCHDNGPLIRTPYLSQIINIDNLAGKINILPGSADKSYNDGSKPYYIVGHDTHLKTHRVEIAGNPCTTCHSLSLWYDTKKPTEISRESSDHLAFDATSLDQGALATNTTKSIGVDSPMWMSIHGREKILDSSDPQIEEGQADAQAIVACAKKFKAANPRTNKPTCDFAENQGRAFLPSSIVNVDGKCLELIGTGVSPKRCVADKDAQKWTFKKDKTIVSKNGKSCLSVGTEIADGMQVKTATCNASSKRQQWKYDGFRARVSNIFVNEAGAEKCFEIGRSAGATSDNRVQLTKCSTSVRKQKWVIQDLQYNTIRNNAETSKSIHVKDGQLAADDNAESVESKSWALERTGEFYRIHNKNDATQFLAIEGGELVSTAADMESDSALWTIRNRPEFGEEVFTIQNKASDSLYITLNGIKPVAAEVDPNSDAKSRWTIAH